MGTEIFPKPEVKLHRKLVALCEFTSGVKAPGTQAFGRLIIGVIVVGGFTITECEVDTVEQLFVTDKVTV